MKNGEGKEIFSWMDLRSSEKIKRNYFCRDAIYGVQCQGNNIELF
jgi:hypothetical protein